MKEPLDIFQRIYVLAGREQCLRLMDVLKDCGALLVCEEPEGVMTISLEEAYLLNEDVCIEAIRE